MNQQEFLKELQDRIHILAEAEQQDILAEYAQHIDLRTAAGLSEEEAIRDFGDLSQLAAEILEAYHVDPAQLGAAPAPERRTPDLSRSLRRAGAAAGAFFRRLGRGTAAFFRRAFQAAAAGLDRCGQALKKLFRRRPKPDAPIPDPIKEKPPVNPTPASRPAPSRAGQTVKQAVRALGRFLRAVLRLAWNLALLLLAVPFGAAGMAALVCIGLVSVLLIQGYPLAGVLLCCLGGALCCAAVLGLLVTLLRRRPVLAAAGNAAPGPGAPHSTAISPIPEMKGMTSARQMEEGEDDHV